ncbi:DUF1877 family protein [Actinokineospora sp. HUAS TT18]|uniref:DUF1877 family protein n=1 Tax=Actinokineospora sp. HUAS TT18 TaxID=3447451 RepID=UPI003F523AE4
MAVTQQLARIPDALLTECRRNAAEVDRVCSFKAAPKSDHLDLDWAPSPLIRCCEIAGVVERLVSSLRDAMEGDFEVNPSYRDFPYGIFDQPVSGLEPSRVKEVADALGEIDSGAIFAALPESADEAKRAIGRSIGDLECHPTEYLAPYFAALHGFYGEAAQRGLAVLQWWD